MGGFVNSISSRVTPGGAIIEEIQVPDLNSGEHWKRRFDVY